MYSVPERMLPRKQTINAGLTLILLVLTFLSFPYLFGQRRPTLASVTSFERNATTSGHTTAGGKASQLLKQNSKSPGSAHASSTPAASGKIDWTRFAYVLHATSLQYLCNSVMIIERLQAVGAKADRVLLYPNDIVLNETDPQGALLIKSRDKYGAILKPVEILRKQSDEPTWAAGHTKFLAFNQTEYERVLHLDSDATVLQPMDELFLLPPSAVALPRAYWLSQSPLVTLSAQLILITPSSHEFSRILSTSEKATTGEYDMEMVNSLYRDFAMVLPHPEYDLLTGEFRGGPDHSKYLGFDEGKRWDPDEALQRAKYLHFSDWPVPKPWVECAPQMWEEQMPKCFDRAGQQINGTGVGLCRDRELWVGFYEDFQRRRLDVCGDGFIEKGNFALQLAPDEEFTAESED